ncbi:hypothetical protein [Rhizobium ruizarguesonis]|jgi:hypothetical protein|uniref:hypothetical protein n=1 Tax=Rhizobium ruizarguesonis TaxID=2081791 RepID=UPI001FD09824|nr:hypothetical protein [Rhizobium ruizarguesonis]
MHITRRQFAALAAVLFLPGMPQAADEENAVFWRAKSAANDHVLFGYVRIRADSFPDIVAEGKRLVDQSKTVLIDVNPASPCRPPGSRTVISSPSSQV